MDEQIELPAEGLPHLGDDAGDIVVGADVALGHERRVNRPGELADAGFDPFALVREGEAGPAVGQPLRDRPRDRALVGDAEDEAALAVEISHGGRVYGFLATLKTLRRLALLPLAAALILASSASATLQPIRRTYSERSLPRVRAGTLKIPSASSRRLTVLADLRLPPLAAYNRNLFSAISTTGLNVRSSSSRAYLARLARAQRVAAAELRRAIPSARIAYRYRVVMDGFAVSLPARKLPALARLPAVTKIYPSVRYELDTNRSPAVIGADTMWATTGDRGDGVKIGIVDDGIDQSNPFFNPAGFSYPAGFPRGATAYTTPEVIVARAYPGPGSGAQGKLPLGRKRPRRLGSRLGRLPGDGAGRDLGCGRLEQPRLRAVTEPDDERCARDAEEHPLRGHRAGSRRLDDRRPDTRRRRHDRRHGRQTGRAASVRSRVRSEQPGHAPHRIVPRRHPARLSGHLRVLDQGRERRDRRRSRPRPRRQPPRRGELHPPAAAAGRRHGLRPRRSAPSRLPGLQGRPRSHPLRQLVQRAQHRPQRHCHQLLLSRADRFRAPAQARRRGPGWSDPFRDPARGARGTIRRLRRDEHVGTARHRRGRAARRAASELDAGRGQVGADVNRRRGLGRHRSDTGGFGSARRRRPRQRSAGGRSQALHDAGLALVRRPRRQRRRSATLASARDSGRGRRRGRVDAGPPGPGGDLWLVHRSADVRRRPAGRDRGDPRRRPRGRERGDRGRLRFYHAHARLRR